MTPLHGGLAQMSEADYEVKRCLLCGARIALASGRQYCRVPCRQIACGKHSTRLMAAFKAKGEWVRFRFDSHATALALQGSINHNHHLFQASMSGRLTLDVRYLGLP
jgi:hypothetical protein